MCFTVVFGTLLTANGSLRILNQIALLSLIVVCVLNLILVPFFGAVGAAIASFAAQTTLGVLQYIVVRHRMKHRLAKNTWLKLAVLALFMGSLTSFEIVFQWSEFHYILIIGFSWILLVFGMKIINLGQILQILKKK